MFLFYTSLILQKLSSGQLCNDSSIQYIHNDRLVSLVKETSMTETINISELQRDITIYPIEEGSIINLHYLQNVLTIDEANDMINLCNNRNGWTRSPQRFKDSMNDQHTGRNSSSCPLIWPNLYKRYLNDISLFSSLSENIQFELSFVSKITKLVASFLECDETLVEPLQIVRYREGEYYKAHHDHGGYYG